MTTADFAYLWATSLLDMVRSRLDYELYAPEVEVTWMP